MTTKKGFLGGTTKFKLQITPQWECEEQTPYNASDYCTACKQRSVTSILGNEQGYSGSCVQHSKGNKNDLQEYNVNKTYLTQIEGREDNVSQDSLQAKRKKRKRCSTICLMNCKFDLVKKIARKVGMREVRTTEIWNVYWTDFSLPVERVKEMRRYQKINHFPGMSEICRKDMLSRNLNRMLKIFPKDYDIFPKTWCLPADQHEVIQYSKRHNKKYFILKPETGCRGQGISIVNNVEHFRGVEKMICQLYIDKPFLIDGYKFDLRIYALIASCDPLRIYVYNEGLARFATSRYRDPSHSNSTNMYMHLTNYSVNKYSSTYVVDDQAGSKRRISSINKWLDKNYVNIKSLWNSIDEVIVKTILSALPMIKHSYQTCFPTHDYNHACFELLGFDILLDSKLKPYLLEVNHSPSFHTDTPVDSEIKEALIMDTFILLNLSHCNTHKIMLEDKQRIKERLLTSSNPKETVEYAQNIEKLKMDQIIWEEKHLGNYRKVYPTTSSSKYDAFFLQIPSTMFQDTFSSHAREEACRLQREELNEKIKRAVKRDSQKKNPQDPESELPPQKTKKAAKRGNQQKEAKNAKITKTRQVPHNNKTCTVVTTKIHRSSKTPSPQSANHAVTIPLNATHTPETTVQPKECTQTTTTLRAQTHSSQPSVSDQVQKSNGLQPKKVSDCDKKMKNEMQEKASRYEVEELLKLLTKQNFILRSSQLLEKVHKELKKSVTLKLENEIKYGRSKYNESAPVAPQVGVAQLCSIFRILSKVINVKIHELQETEHYPKVA